jgi:hypothetical protein
MDVGDLRRTLQRAGRLFGASGATASAASLDRLDAALSRHEGRTPVADVVREAAATLAEPAPHERSAESIATELDRLGTDEAAFASLLQVIESRAFPVAKACEVALRYANAQERTKPKALKAIRHKFESRVWYAAKDKLDEGVTPF